MSESGGEPDTAAELRAIAARSISKTQVIRKKRSKCITHTIALFKSVLSEVSSLLPVFFSYSAAGGASYTSTTLYRRLR